MSYRSQQPRTHRATRGDPRGVESDSSSATRQSTAGRMSRTSQSSSATRNNTVDLTLDSDEERRPAPPPSQPSNTREVIDLLSPSPPPATSGPSRPPATVASSSRAAQVPSAAVTKKASKAPGWHTLLAPPRPSEDPSNDTSTVTSPRGSSTPIPLQKISEIADHTPSPPIKASPQSSIKRSSLKHSRMSATPVSSDNGKAPQTQATSSSSKQKTHQANAESSSSTQASPQIKQSLQSSRKRKTRSSQHEAEPESSPSSEGEQQASSPSSSSEDEPIVYMPPSKRQRTSPPESSRKRPSPDADADSDAPRRKSPRLAKNSDKSNSYKSDSDKSTIGSSSPLIERLTARKTRAQASNPVVEPDQDVPAEDLSQELPPVESVIASLRELAQNMRNDHSMSVKWILKDANDGALASTEEVISVNRTLGVSKRPSFASEPSVQLPPKQKLPNGSSGESLISWVMSKSNKFTKTTSTQIATKLSGNTPRVPRYSSHTNVTRNILNPDNQMLKYVPYLGDAAGSSYPGKNDKETNYRRLLKELEEAYSHGRIEAPRQREQASRIRSYLVGWLAESEIPCNDDTVIQYMVSQEDANLGLSEAEKEMILESFGEPLSELSIAAAELFWEACDEVFNMSLPNVMLPVALLNEMKTSASKKAHASPEKHVFTPGERLGTYASLTCLICGAVDCQTHADYIHEEIVPANGAVEGQNGEDQAERQPLHLSYNDMLRRFNVRKAAEAEFDLPRRPSRNQNPCGESCWKSVGDDKTDDQADLSEKDLYAIQEMMIGITNKDQQACNIAFTLNLPCWQVHYETDENDRVDSRPTVAEPTGRAKRPDWYDAKRKTLHSNWAEMTNAHLHQDRSQAFACAHEGHCTSKCPCVQANILCESFCGCADDCPRRFTGCSCLAIGTGVTCVAESCICIQMNRECGPQCVSCGANDRINPAKKYDDDLFTWGCQNVPLQRGLLKATVVGESQLVGFGLYLAEPVRKGEFISEYTGEVISSQEAERRGITYDRKYMSFLFDLNRDYVIDAAHLGNNTRFINHADCEKNGLNCEAKIFLVNGEHRIKFVALRDIEIGEELLFNYGKKFAEKHGLSKKLPKANEGGGVGKKGVLVGEEALDALDGVADRKKSARVGTATRGRPRGSRGRGNKMRKTATPGRVTAVEDPDSVVESVSQEQEDDLYTASTNEENDDEDEEEEEEEEEEVIPEGRRKRNVKKPARYTR